MEFEWDEDKNRANRLKHGVAFEDAIRVFADPLAMFVQDRHVKGEERWQAIGVVGSVNLVVVAHTIRDGGEGLEVVRIISARRAERHERRRYEESKDY